MSDNAVDPKRSLSLPLIGTLAALILCHAVWNALVYIFFGYGTSAAALGVSQYNLYDPERGFLGIALNAAAAAILWRWASGRNRTL